MRSPRWRELASLACVIVLAATIGCGSSSDTTSPPTLPPPGQRAEDHLNALLANQNRDINAATEAAYFSDYHQRYPSDPVGTLGYALSRIASVLQSLAQTYGLTDNRLADLANFRSAVRRVGQMRPADITQVALSAAAGRGIVGAQGARSRAYTPADVANAVRTQVIPALRDSIAALAPLVTSSQTIYEYNQGGEHFAIRAQEVQAFRAALRLALAATATAAAYNWNDGGFNWNRDAATLDANHDGSLTPQEYLPTGAFLTLSQPALMQEALSALLGALNDARAVAQFMSSQTPYPYQLLALPEEPVPWADVLTGVNQAQTALAGSLSTSVAYWDYETQTEKTVTVTVNLRALWTNPPTDLKALMPTLGYWPESGLFIRSIPDKTLHGILVNGNTLPAAFWQYLYLASEHAGA